MSNLPGQLTPLIGRERELATVQQLLHHPHVRLLTLTGPGGVGKTRLALQAAKEFQGQLSDGVFFVSLVSVSEAALVPHTIARTLGLRVNGPQPVLDRLIAFLQDKNQLLLLDNFEQVVLAGPALVDLLEACPQLKLLITSREVLRVRGEQEFAVPLLSLPDLSRLNRSSAHLPNAVANYASVALFLERVRAIEPDFQPDEKEISAIAEICVRLDGLPLALELAAPRLKLFAPQDLLARLSAEMEGSSLRLLTGGARDLPARQRTLRHAIQWSYDLLGPEDQQLFRQLSIFVGGFTLSAAETLLSSLESLGYPFDVTPGRSPVTALDGAASLLDKSLLQRDQTADEPRLVMLMMLGEFGLEQLELRGETAAAQQAHAITFLALAEEAMPHLDQPEQTRWLGQLAQEHENLQAALCWALNQGEVKVASRFGVALWPYWIKQGYLIEGLRWLEQILALSAGEAAEPDPSIEKNGKSITALRAEMFYGAGMLAYRQYAWGENWPRPYFEESLDLFGLLGDLKGTANVLTALGRLSMSGDVAVSVQSCQPCEEALAIQRQLNNSRGIAAALDSLSRLAMTQADYDLALSYAEECLTIYRDIGDRLGEADVLHLIGNISFFQDEFTLACAGLEEAAALYLALGNRHDMVNNQALLALTQALQDELGAAEIRLCDTLSLAQEIGHERATLNCLAGLGVVALKQGHTMAAEERLQKGLAVARRHRVVRGLPVFLQALAMVKLAGAEPVEAARLLGAADAYRHTFGLVNPSLSATLNEQTLHGARAELGEAKFAAAWASGPQLFLDLAPDAFSRTATLEAAPIPPLAECHSLAQSADSVFQPTAEPRPSDRPTRTLAERRTDKAVRQGTSHDVNQLTPRELDVLRLVALGLTNTQVATELVVSPRTIHAHLRSVYSKLDVSSRTAATRYAIEHNLLNER